MERVINQEGTVRCSVGVGDTLEAAISCEWPASRTTSTTRKTTSSVCLIDS